MPRAPALYVSTSWHLSYAIQAAMEWILSLTTVVYIYNNFNFESHQNFVNLLLFLIHIIYFLDYNTSSSLIYFKWNYFEPERHPSRWQPSYHRECSRTCKQHRLEQWRGCERDRWEPQGQGTEHKPQCPCTAPSAVSRAMKHMCEPCHQTSSSSTGTIFNYS